MNAIAVFGHANSSLDWFSLEDLDHFVASDAGKQHEDALYQIVASPMECTRYRLQGGYYANDDTHVEFCAVYFHPSKIDDGESVNSLLANNGIREPTHQGFSPDSTASIMCQYRTNPRKGISADELSWNGKQVKALVYENYWKSKEKEADFKNNSTKTVHINDQGQRVLTRVKIFENWACEMMRLGAFGWTSEHWHAHQIPKWIVTDNI